MRSGGFQLYIEGLYELDNKIIEIIKDNARLTYSEIGAKAGVSRISVRKRMESLEKKGIIQGYKAVIDPTKVPEGVKFILDLETTPECFEDIVEWLSGSKYIRQIYSVSGDCAIHATGFVSNSKKAPHIASNIRRFCRTDQSRAQRLLRRPYADAVPCAGRLADALFICTAARHDGARPAPPLIALTAPLQQADDCRTARRPVSCPSTCPDADHRCSHCARSSWPARRNS